MPEEYLQWLEAQYGIGASQFADFINPDFENNQYYQFWLSTVATEASSFWGVPKAEEGGLTGVEGSFPDAVDNIPVERWVFFGESTFNGKKVTIYAPLFSIENLNLATLSNGLNNLYAQYEDKSFAMNAQPISLNDFVGLDRDANEYLRTVTQNSILDYAQSKGVTFAEIANNPNLANSVDNWVNKVLGQEITDVSQHEEVFKDIEKQRGLVTGERVNIRLPGEKVTPGVRTIYVGPQELGKRRGFTEFLESDTYYNLVEPAARKQQKWLEEKRAQGYQVQPDIEQGARVFALSNIPLEGLSPTERANVQRFRSSLGPPPEPFQVRKQKKDELEGRFKQLAQKARTAQRVVKI